MDAAEKTRSYVALPSDVEEDDLRVGSILLVYVNCVQILRLRCIMFL